MKQLRKRKTKTNGWNAPAELAAWMDALEFYARDRDELFDARPGYFTQEFWRLLAGCLRADAEAEVKRRPFSAALRPGVRP